LLASDAVLRVPGRSQISGTYHGPEAIAEFLAAGAAWRGESQVRLIPTRVNGQPAFGYYLADAEQHLQHPPGLTVLTLRRNRVRAIIRFLEPGPLSRFDLPPVE
jgi:RNA polymerase sigma-70 factor (ECF subfamily)